MQVFKILYLLFHHNLMSFLIWRNLLCILPLSGWNNFKPWEISRKNSSESNIFCAPHHVNLNSQSLL